VETRRFELLAPVTSGEIDHLNRPSPGLTPRPGMHKHFRMIAISEHLRNHGFDPDYYTHTRIPFIWQKLRTLYNLDIIDDRENTFDYLEDESFDDRYLDFSLRGPDFHDMMLQRAEASEAGTSPPQLDLSPSPTPKKRKRGDAKARASTVDDTEEGTDVPSPAHKSARSARSQKRAAAPASKTKGKASKADESEPEESEESHASENTEEAEEESPEEGGTPASKSARGASSRGRGGPVRGRGRAGRRGRGRGG